MAYIQIKKCGLPCKRNSGSHLSVRNFKVFKFCKERFANDKFKIMNTLFQPFELNNI